MVMTWPVVAAGSVRRRSPPRWWSCPDPVGPADQHQPARQVGEQRDVVAEAQPGDGAAASWAARGWPRPRARARGAGSSGTGPARAARTRGRWRRPRRRLLDSRGGTNAAGGGGDGFRNPGPDPPRAAAALRTRMVGGAPATRSRIAAAGLAHARQPFGERPVVLHEAMCLPGGAEATALGGLQSSRTTQSSRPGRAAGYRFTIGVVPRHDVVERLRQPPDRL